MTTTLTTGLSFPLQGMHFGEKQPKPSVCDRCGAVRTYSSKDGFAWIREKCQCDFEREQLRQDAMLRARKLQVSSLITNGLYDLDIPDRYRLASFGEMPSEPDMQLALWSETIQEQSNGWYIFGGVGYGKTHLAFAMLRHAIESGALIVGRNNLDINRMRRLGAAWIYTPDWVEMQRPGHDDPASAEELSRVKVAYLLLIDDILPKQITNPTPFYVERVNSLINDRCNRCLPTIITSNYDLSEIGKRLGHPIMSRIREMCELFELTGRDRRLGGVR